jgi:oligosaccharide 4-alpha-D-glucosyltransferase
MKKYIACLLACICTVQAFAQCANDGKWDYQFYPANIVKLTWTGTNTTHNEQISDAVIAKPLQVKKPPSGVQVKHFDSAITVVTGGATVHFLNGFDSGHHRGVMILLHPGEKLFGGGERALPLNRVGQRITLYNNPWYGYGEGADQLNYSVPVLVSTAGYGLLFDNPSKGYFDVGKTRPEFFEAGFESGAVDVYIIPGKNMDEILRNYTLLTGRQPLPPRWALGNFVSRFGYRSQQQAEDVIRRTQQDSFPADAIILDLFWFGDSIKGTLGNLDWNRNKWPTPETMISNFKKQNINTILVTEPFILQGTKNYHASLPYLATDSSGKHYTLQDFYFGKGGLVDLFRPEAQQWFWQFYKTQIDKGIAGWWGDLGEPEKHPADMYHNASSFDVNRLMSANEVHNMYGHQWSKMLSQHYAKEYPAQRLFYLNRAGFAGSQRYSVFPWTGDVGRNWIGFRAQLLNLQSMSLSGIPYIHSDAGGFGGGDNDPELYIRWLQFAAYTPIFRPHGTALGDLEPGVKDIPSEPTFQQEPYKTIARNLIRNRYALLPYNYSLAYEQTSLGRPLIRPMFYYNATDTVLLQTADQYMWADAFLVAPVLQPGATSRRLYLPKGQWYNLQNNAVKTGGAWTKDSTDISTMPVYVKEGSFIPMWNQPSYTSTASYQPSAPVTIRYYPSINNSSYTFFDDDGRNPQSIAIKAFQQLLFKGNTINNITRISIEAKIWPKGLQRKLIVELPGNNLSAVTINGKTVDIKQSNEQWQAVELLFDGKPQNLVMR